MSLKNLMFVVIVLMYFIILLLAMIYGRLGR